MDDQNKTAPFNDIQGIASNNVPAYANGADNYISFDPCYIHGIYTGYKWQCVEYARRWLLLRKSCIFQSFGSAADMWKELKHVERVTDGRKFSLKVHSTGSSTKPVCESFLIYPRGEEIPFGHIAVICEVGEDFIRVAEQNYRFHYWPGDYSRQIPMIKHDGLYYIDDYYNVYGWMEIENNDQLTPFNPSNSILPKYQQSKPIGKLECCFVSKEALEHEKENVPFQLKNKDRSYIKADEDLFLNVSSTSNDLYRIVEQATEDIVRNDELLTGFGIPKIFWSRIRHSWSGERDLDLIDHLDLKFDGKKLKLCPYRTKNALNFLQSAILEEERIEAMKVDYDFTSSFQLHRILVKNWKRLTINTTVHILIDNSQRAMITALYMKKIMIEAGIDSKLCVLPEDLTWKDSDIVDKDGEIVKTVWKMWDWEMIFQDYIDRYGDQVVDNRWKDVHPCLYDILLNQNIRVIEPMWKSIISHSTFLPVLSVMHPNHSNILQDERILSKGSDEIPYMNWSTSVNSNGNLGAGFQTDDGTNRYFNYHSIPQEFFVKKNDPYSDKSIISWIMNGNFSGFSIRDDQNQITDGNDSRTYCCLI